VKHGNIDRSEVVRVSGFQLGSLSTPNTLQLVLFFLVLGLRPFVSIVEEMTVLFEFRHDAVFFELVVRIHEELVDYEYDCDGIEIAEVVNFFSKFLVVFGGNYPEDRIEILQQLARAHVVGSFQYFLLTEVLVFEEVVLFPYFACHFDEGGADSLWEILLDHQ
jgi:hypothetical protein